MPSTLPPPQTVDTATRQLAAALGGGAAGRLAARALVEAEILGQPRFGFDLLTESRGRNPEPALPESTDHAVAWIDASGLDSPVALAAATLALPARARRHGLAATFLTGIAGFGRFAPFVRHLADEGLAGMAGTGGGPVVAPAGGRQGVLSTNPFAFALGRDDNRVVIDATTAAITLADVKTARLLGQPLPEGSALDAAGQPTRDPALMASLLPRGGTLGSLLGLVVELLAGVIAGGRGAHGSRGVFLLAIDPSRADDDAWRERLRGLHDDWRAAGGHWPGGRPVAADTPLPPTLQARLEAAVTRLEQAPQRATRPGTASSVVNPSQGDTARLASSRAAPAAPSDPTPQ